MRVQTQITCYCILWLTCLCLVLPVHASADAGVQALTADPAGRKQTLSPLCWARATGCPDSIGLQADPSPDPERRQRQQMEHKPS